MNEITKKDEPEIQIVDSKEINEGTPIEYWLEQAKDHGQSLLNLFEQYNEIQMKTWYAKREKEFQHFRFSQNQMLKYTKYVGIVIGVMILISAILTAIDKLDGSAFTFLLGTIIGSFITMIMRFKPSEYYLSDEEED